MNNKKKFKMNKCYSVIHPVKYITWVEAGTHNKSDINKVWGRFSKYKAVMYFKVSCNFHTYFDQIK